MVTTISSSSPFSFSFSSPLSFLSNSGILLGRDCIRRQTHFTPAHNTLRSNSCLAFSARTRARHSGIGDATAESMRLTAIDQCEGGLLNAMKHPGSFHLERDPCSWTGRPALNMKPRDKTKYEPKKQAYLRAHSVIRGKRRGGRGKGEKCNI